MDISSFSLTGRGAIVTGAGQGIGEGIATSLAALGADIVVAELNPETAERTASSIRGLGRRALAIPVDVTDAEAARAMVVQARAFLGRLDILVNNAGGAAGAGQQPMLDMTLEDWDRVISLNLRAAMVCNVAAAREMMDLGTGGSIVNIASLAGMVGWAMSGPYSTAKAGLINLTRTLSAEWGPHGIRVNAVAPGPILSPASTRGGELLIPGWEKQLRRMPIRRFGQPADIAGAVAFFCSDAAGFVTGQLLAVDGGIMGSGPVAASRSGPGPQPETAANS